MSQSQIQPLNISNKNYEETYDQPSPVITRKVIVPLEDGESDSETTCNSPQKLLRSYQTRDSNADHAWELERLREIQEEEGNILGYCFAERDGLNSSQSYSPCSYDEEEEVIQEDEDNVADSIQRRLLPLKIKEVIQEEEEDVEDSLHRRLQPTKIKLRTSTSKPNNSSRVAKFGIEQEGFLRKVLGSAIKKRVGNDKISKKLAILDTDTVSIMQRGKMQEGSTRGIKVNDRLGPISPKKSLDRMNYNKAASKLSVKERLGLAKRGLDPDTTKPDLAIGKSDNSIKRRLGLKEDLSKNILGIKASNDLENTPSSNINVKSLADIKAEKLTRRGIQGFTENSCLHQISTEVPTEKFPSSAFSRIKPVEKDTNVGLLKIKTLAEIKAEKGKDPGFAVQISSSVQQHTKSLKRPISPIRFNDNPNKKTKAIGDFTSSNKEILFPLNKEISPSSNKEVLTSSNKESLPFKNLDLGSRKINLRKATGARTTSKSETVRKVCETGKQLNNEDRRKVILIEPSTENTNKLIKIKPTQANINSAPFKISDIKTKTNTIELKTKTSESKSSLNPSNKKSVKSVLNESKMIDSVKDLASKSTGSNSSKLNISRLDSVLDEEALLLGDDDLPDIDDEEINEDELLL